MLSDSQKQWFLVVSCFIWIHPKCFTSYYLRDPFDIIIRPILHMTHVPNLISSTLLRFILPVWSIWYHPSRFNSHHPRDPSDIIQPVFFISSSTVIHFISTTWSTSFHHRSSIHITILLHLISHRASLHVCHLMSFPCLLVLKSTSAHAIWQLFIYQINMSTLLDSA